MNGFAEYLFEKFPEDAAHVIEIADQVCRNYFTFTSKWDLEQAPYPVEFDGQIDWEVNPCGDPEFVWQFNRHRFFLCLGQAYLMTGQEKYAKKLVELLCDWIQRVPLVQEHEDKAWRSLEAGFRGEYWTKAAACIQGSTAFTPQVQKLYEDSLLQHARYLEEKHSAYKCISNWGVIENHGLFEIAVTLADQKQEEHYAKLALEHLQQAVRIQFMDDGVHWEQAFMYHCEVVRCYLDVFLIARKHGICLPAGMEDTIKKALYAMMAWQKPDSHMFMSGDSDDLDMQECFMLGAYYYQDEKLKGAAGGRLDYEAAWCFGLVLGLEPEKRAGTGREEIKRDMGADAFIDWKTAVSAGRKALEDYESLGERQPDFCSAALTDSGHFYLRSDWGPGANLAHFTCGTLGAGHGHSDKLHVDLVMGGRDVLVDAGRYTYRMEQGRREFKDPQAHNTSIVDGKLFTVCKDSWECTKLSQPANTAYRFTDKYGYVQGGHLGYMEDGVFMNRRIVQIQPDIYIVIDEMYGAGSHTYETYFHFSEAGSVELSDIDKFTICCEEETGSADVTDTGKCAVCCEEETGSVDVTDTGRNTAYSKNVADSIGTADISSRTAQYKDAAGSVDICFLAEGFAHGQAEVSRESSWIARHYNQKMPNSCLKVTLHSDGFTSLYTVFSSGSIRACEKISAGSALKSVMYEPKQAEALRIQTDRTEYILIVCHEEVSSPTDLVTAGGCAGFGNVIVFDRAQEEFGGTVLHW